MFCTFRLTSRLKTVGNIMQEIASHNPPTRSINGFNLFCQIIAMVPIIAIYGYLIRLITSLKIKKSHKLKKFLANYF